jgi:hypothetical protein
MLVGQIRPFVTVNVSCVAASFEDAVERRSLLQAEGRTSSGQRNADSRTDDSEVGCQVLRTERDLRIGRRQNMGLRVDRTGREDAIFGRIGIDLKILHLGQVRRDGTAADEPTRDKERSVGQLSFSLKSECRRVAVFDDAFAELGP